MTKGENTDFSWCLTLDVFKNFKTKNDSHEFILFDKYFVGKIL